MTERESVEIDYCPKCRSVWLDRGELDKIMDRAGEQPIPGPTHDRRQGESRGTGREREYPEHHGRHKRESFFSRLFDFD
jgi:uncharacterized protein